MDSRKIRKWTMKISKNVMIYENIVTLSMDKIFFLTQLECVTFNFPNSEIKKHL